MIKYTSIKKYKMDLVRELGPIDDEIVWDAVSNSEDHLNLMVEEILEEGSGIQMKKAVELAVESFGYPSEIAEVYRSFCSNDL